MDDIREIENFGTGEWVGQTTLHPLGLVIVLLCGAAMLYVPRRYAVWTLIATACLVAPAQRIVVLGLNFNLLRIIVVFGFLRLLVHGETTRLTLIALDWAMVAFVLSRTAAYTVLWGTGEALKYQLGESFDAIGLYFLLRCLVQNWSDVGWAVAGYMVFSVPIALAFVVENRTGHNLFAFFGGVPAITMVREGRLRCQGAFSHPILAGCFWSSMVPLIVAHWWTWTKSHAWIVTSLVACTVLIVLSASSTPVVGVGVGLLGGLCFYFRRRMRLVRWGALATLVGLHLVMKAPVWHLVSRLSLTEGDTGYHRFMLIDQAIHRVREWWLVGTQTTAHWFWGGQDVTNQFILEAVNGGLLTLMLFITTIVLAFRAVGQLRAAQENHPARRAIAWSLGIVLLVHCSNFIAVSYFGQIILNWYLLFAMIGSLAAAQQAVGKRVVRTVRKRRGSPRLTSARGAVPQLGIVCGATRPSSET